MTRADVLIGDVSGLTSEFLFTRKPVHPADLGCPAARSLDAPTLRARVPVRLPLGCRPRAPARPDRRRSSAQDPLADARARAADRAFRGHLTVDDAVATFELALEAARGRGRRRSVASVFEASLRDARARA